MSKKDALLAKLDELVELAEEQNRVYLQGRNALWRALVRLYLWWRDAKTVDGFLEECYERYDIVGRLRGGEENFTRVLRLVWRMQWNGPSAAKLQQWSLALRKLDIEFETNRASYRANAEDKLVTFIDAQGGVAGLIGFNAQLPEDPDSETPRKRGKPRVNPDDEAKIFAKHLELGELFFQQKSKPIVSIETTFPVPTTRKDYAVALLRKKSASRFDVLAMLNDEQMVSTAIVDGYKRSTDTAPQVLAAMTEVIASQSLPLAVERHRASLVNPSKVRASDGSLMKQSKRLLFRANEGDVLLSDSRTDCSVVTLAKLHGGNCLDAKKDVFLNVLDRKYIEQNIIQCRNLGIYTAHNTDKVPAVRGIKASHKLLIENSVTKRVRGLYFYEIDSIGQESRFQACIADDLPEAVWRATVDRLWIERLNALFVSPWLREYGDQIKRDNKRSIQLQLSPTKVVIAHFGERGFYSHSSPSFDVEKVQDSKSIKLTFWSREIFPVLNGLLHMGIDKKIELSACDAYFSISCKTPYADYKIYVPPITSMENRVSTAFKRYGA